MPDSTSPRVLVAAGDSDLRVFLRDNLTADGHPAVSTRDANSTHRQLAAHPIEALVLAPLPTAADATPVCAPADVRRPPSASAASRRRSRSDRPRRRPARHAVAAGVRAAASPRRRAHAGVHQA